MKTKNIIALALLVLAFRFWVLQPFIIPSSSMDTQLIKGDYVIVNKWQNSIFGTIVTPSINEVFAFHYPLEKTSINNKSVYIKRCVALPGDSLTIEAGLTLNDETNLQFDYLIKDPDNVLNWKLLNELGVHLGGKTTHGNWLLSMNEQQINKLKQQSTHLVFNKHTQTKAFFDLSTFPSDTSKKWNRDFYGPIYVPKAGETIDLKPTNISLYKRIIEVYENQELVVNESTIILNGVPTDRYTFKQNYYFMMGDNRHHSKDSRHWGFVPEDHLIGSCSLILFNIDQFSIHRLAKFIN